MGNRTGRRARRKRRRQKSGQDRSRTVSLCHKSQYVELMRWLKERGFSSRSLVPALFSDTGRGLMTMLPVQAGDVLISLPETCLLTTTTVLRSPIGEYIRRWKPPLSPLLAICVFLISERHLGSQSQWKPYIDVLPKSYTCPAYFSDSAIGLLPGVLRKKALDQRDAVLEMHCSSLGFFHTLQPHFSQPVEDIFSLDAMRWAWCTVNSRTVYVQRCQSPFLSGDPDVYAMAPYLDLLNHSPVVQVEAGFNRATSCYEIRSTLGCKRFTQAFICYGAHDSQRLLLEYGFVAPNNPHRVVYVDPDLLQKFIIGADRQFSHKLLYLKDHHFLENLTFGVEGPSWKLMTTLRLLSLGPEQYASWKTVLLGAAVSQDCEERSVHLARILCQHLMEENTDALERLSLMKLDADLSLREQLSVVESLRCEEQKILGYSFEVLQLVWM
ncbi:SET domain-containing protein 4 [Brienomyrus brachyistius]|uniref:SET domain-containing protein 4 n=1 Tax=Brienomyrus brachyistius TaxID=42636 RepID=UPI0020B27F37|nr:SET domain-containing protein 4 [Brienomyrus brachyistius]